MSLRFNSLLYLQNLSDEDSKMAKEYICYVGIYNSKIGFLLEDDNKNNKFYDFFEDLIKDVDIIYFQLDSKSVPALSEFEIIFQFKIKKKGSPDGSDSSLTIEVKSEILTITDKSKRCFEELKKRVEPDDKKVKYSIAINNAEPVKQTLLWIFGLFICMFVVVNSEIGGMSEDEKRADLDKMAEGDATEMLDDRKL